MGKVTQSNFDFIPKQWALLRDDALQAERFALIQPRTSAFYARRTLERVVFWLYDFDTTLQRPPEATLMGLIREPCFYKLIAPVGLFHSMKTIVRFGNDAAHNDAQINPLDGYNLVKLLHEIIGWWGKAYLSVGNVPAFDKSLLPQNDPSIELRKATEVIMELQKQYETDKLRSDEERERLQREIEENKRNTLEQVKKAVTIIKDTDSLRWIVDTLLRETGWDKLVDINGQEIQLVLVSGSSNQGLSDYILKGDHGLPVAVVECRISSQDLRRGKRKAEEIADQLERETGQRPIIYYTNGEEIWLWDDTFYPPRIVDGYATTAELQRLIDRRKLKGRLQGIEPRKNIISQSHEVEVLARVMAYLDNEHQRRVLLMTRGSKDPVVMTVAIVDVLMRQHWISNVLYLAERSAAAKKAEKAFLTCLSADSGELVFATYDSVVKLIDETGDKSRGFSVNHFDLLILNEGSSASQSGLKLALNYFDSLAIGFTSLSRDKIDRHVYEGFIFV